MLSALVVDDVVTNRDILAKLLERVGTEVHQAEGGTQALQWVGQAMPDIVFLDIRMPDLDGHEPDEMGKIRLKASPLQNLIF